MRTTSAHRLVRALARRSDGRLSRMVRACVMLLVAWPLTPRVPVLTARMQRGAVDEYRVKAAFVYRLPQFVAWPTSALETSPTLDICVVRPDPFSGVLDDLTRGERLGRHVLRLRHIGGAGDLSSCHAVFVGADAEAGRDVLRAAAGRPVLTVGETDSFLNEGGIVVLKVINRRVRFEVDAANARRAGLRIDARLLDLAIAVRGGPS